MVIAVFHGEHHLWMMRNVETENSVRWSDGKSRSMLISPKLSLFVQNWSLVWVWWTTAHRLAWTLGTSPCSWRSEYREWLNCIFSLFPINKTWPTCDQRRNSLRITSIQMSIYLVQQQQTVFPLSLQSSWTTLRTLLYSAAPFRSIAHLSKVGNVNQRSPSCFCAFWRDACYSRPSHSLGRC